MDRLFVILGAGASKDCSTPEFVRRRQPVPPLVKDLFSAAYTDILGQYKQAQSAGAELRKAPDAVALEELIRTRYRNSKHRPDRRKYRSIPFYLQHLLQAVSQSYTNQPDNYDVLISVLTRLPDVVFVTLNYDTLLDDRLHATVDPIKSLEDYVQPDRNWCLIKLHGSVNWGRFTDAALDPHDPDPDVTIDSDIVWLAGAGASLGDLRSAVSPGPDGPAVVPFPALAVPVGQEDELVCPPDHVQFLRDKLEATDRAHLLVIGYSGYDKEVLSVFEKSGVRVASLHVVNTGHDAAMEVASRIGPKFGIGVPLEAGCDVPFCDFVQKDRLDRYLDDLPL